METKKKTTAKAVEVNETANVSIADKVVNQTKPVNDEFGSAIPWSLFKAMYDHEFIVSKADSQTGEVKNYLKLYSSFNLEKSMTLFPAKDISLTEEFLKDNASSLWVARMPKIEGKKDTYCLFLGGTIEEID